MNTFAYLVLAIFKNVSNFSRIVFQYTVNPYFTNGFSHHYQLDESTFTFRSVRSVTSGAMLFAYVP